MNQPEATGHAKPQRKRTARGRALVWGGISLLLIAVLVEWRSQQGFDATLEDLGQRLKGSKVLPSADLHLHTHGFAYRGEEKIGQRRWITLQWPSLFRRYRLRLQVLDGDSICSVDAFESMGDDKPVREGPAIVEKLRGLPEGNQDVVALTTTRLESINGILKRELIRQALLIAAQDELHVSTLDPSIGNEIPLSDTPATFPFAVQIKSNTVPQAAANGRPNRVRPDLNVVIELSRKVIDGPAFQWTSPEFVIPAEKQIETMAIQMEWLSRGPFVDAWKKAGYKKGDGPTSQPLSPVTLEDHMDVVSQFGLLRAYHSQIRNSGESAEALGGLVRAYANLGNLTDFYWSSLSKTFKARGLLYAQRLIVRAGDSPYTLSHRAYALALAGRHGTALEAVQSAKGASGTVAPDWLKVIDAYCSYDLESLDETQGENRELALYLRMRMVEPDSISSPEALERIQQFAELNPASSRPREMLGETEALGLHRQLTESGYRSLWPAVYRRLASLSDLPPGAKKIADAESKFNPLRFHREFSARAQMIAELSQAESNPANSPLASWRVLAEILKDESFVQAYRILHVQYNMLGMNADLTLETLKPLFREHRFGQFLESFTSNRQLSVEKLTEFVNSFDQALCDMPGQPIAWETARKNLHNLHQRAGALGAQDDLCEDIVRLRMVVLSEFNSKRFLEISPSRPWGIAYMIEHYWHDIGQKADELETKYVAYPSVMIALATKYESVRQFTDAKRCLKKSIENSPTAAAYKSLAKIYKTEENLDAWQETLEQALELPSFGLDDAVIQVEIADALMRKGEWQKAEPFAMSAAGSGSAWGLKTGARCAEGLGKWDQAEELIQAASLRYSEQSADWYFWCIRTGRGNVQAAQKVADSYCSRLAPPLNHDQYRSLAVWNMIRGNLPEARIAFENASNHRDPATAIYAAVIADGLGQTEVRDALLRQFSEGLMAHYECFADFANLMRGVLSGEERGRWNPNELERLAVIASEKDVAYLYFFAALFLSNHGQMEHVNEYRQCAATVFNVQRFTCILANHTLREQNEKIGPTRMNDLPDSIAPLAALLKKAADSLSDGDADKAEALYNQVLELRADFIPGILARGSFHQSEGHYAAAIADYEAALKLDPRCYQALNGLGWILATCEEDDIRNGTKALEYAQRAADLRFYPWKTALSTTAAAHAELGNFTEALQLERDAQKLHSYREISSGQDFGYARQKPFRHKPTPAKRTKSG